MTLSQLLEAMKEFAPCLFYGAVACQWFCTLTDLGMMFPGDEPEEAVQAAYTWAKEEGYLA